MKKNKKNILLIEDEENLQKVIKLNLELENYKVDALSKAPNILEILKQYPYDLIILDLMLPEKDGITICETIRTQNLDVKILILSARTSSTDRAMGLNKGADDYMVKPFELNELFFRIKKLLGTPLTQNKKTIFGFNNNIINIDLLEAKNFKNKTIPLSKKEALLLKLLIEHPNIIQQREKILSQIWEYNYISKTRTLDNYILKFRKHFEENPNKPKHFISKRGIGYVFIE